MRSTLAEKVERGEDLTPQQVAAEVLELVKTEPDLHDQDFWYVHDGSTLGGFDVDAVRADLAAGHCTTTACVAGWAAILTSPKGSRLSHGEVVRLPTGMTTLIRSVGRDALGLDDDAATWLFDQGRSRDDVLAALTHLAGGGDRTYEALYEAAALA